MTQPSPTTPGSGWSRFWSGLRTLVVRDLLNRPDPARAQAPSPRSSYRPSPGQPPISVPRTRAQAKAVFVTPVGDRAALMRLLDRLPEQIWADTVDGWRSHAADYARFSLLESGLLSRAQTRAALDMIEGLVAVAAQGVYLGRVDTAGFVEGRYPLALLNPNPEIRAHALWVRHNEAIEQQRRHDGERRAFLDAADALPERAWLEIRQGTVTESANRLLIQSRRGAREGWLTPAEADRAATLIATTVADLRAGIPRDPVPLQNLIGYYTRTPESTAAADAAHGAWLQRRAAHGLPAPSQPDWTLPTPDTGPGTADYDGTAAAAQARPGPTATDTSYIDVDFLVHPDPPALDAAVVVDGGASM